MSYQHLYARVRVPANGNTYKQGQMNKTESAYANALELQKRAGVIVAYEFESVKLRLADNTFYTPDFMIITADGAVEFHEVKGFWRDDARVKIKVAADKFPYYIFKAVKTAKGGKWDIEDFS